MALAIRFEGSQLDIGQGDANTTTHALDVFDEIGEFLDFSGPDGEAGEIDVTHSKSTAKEFLLDLPDSGNFSATLNLVPGDVGQTAARNARDAQGLKNFRLTLTDAAATKVEFKGFVKGFSISAASASKVTATISIRISGAVTYV